MDTSASDLLFLQSLYQQDTLYLVPEKNILADQPVPQTVSLTETTLPIANPVKSPDTAMDVQENGPETGNNPSESLERQDIAWMGEALKGTYLLFEVPVEEFNQLPQHIFLKKILAAVGLGTLEVKFGNLSTDKSHNIKQIAQAVQARHILVFGDTLPIENLLKLEPYRMYRLEETRFVRVDALSVIEQSTELKGKLWEVLQKIFLQ